MLGAVFAVLSAFSFSLNSVLVRRGVVRASAAQGQFVTVLIGVPMFAVSAVVTGQLFRAGEVTGSGYLLLAAAGILHFGLGRYCNYRALSAIGATRTSPLFALAIPYSVLMAVIFLHETVNVPMAIGIVLILLGPAIIVQRQRSMVPAGGADAAMATAPLRMAEGYTFGVLGVLLQGTTPLLIRGALADTGLGVLGGLVAYAAASAVLTLTMAMPARRQLMRSTNLDSLRLFLGAGTSVFFAQMFRFLALSLAPVTLVTPLQRTGGIFTLGLSWALNRKLERITPAVVVGILVSVAGAALLVMARPT